MAHFYGDLQGNKGEATRMGTKESGIRGHIRGWNLGCSVTMRHDKTTGEDICTIRLTGGSNYRSLGVCLGNYTREDLEKIITITKK